MDNKSAVSAIQEFCAKTKNCPPTYDYIEGEDGGYMCKATLMEVESYGNGRSKRDAKHLAAVNIMRKIRILPGVGDMLADVESYAEDEATNLNIDMLKELRDFCVRHEMPLPSIEVVQQSGTPSAPEFVACCKVASITRYGKSDKKKDARQRAAIEMLTLISKDVDASRVGKMQMVSTKPTETMEVRDVLEDAEAERRKKFNTYRELTDAGSVEKSGLRLCDRHNYFKSFYPPLKASAFEVINSSNYVTAKDKALSLLSSLKITPRITTLEATSMEPLLQIELNCDYDCVFLGLESKIYNDMVLYFSEMLI
ncbi:hypothetical protein KR009_007213 [Drosophila setifemur]|nr:hypothetical protein KR009_007213 [Drosophila setifemur]